MAGGPWNRVNVPRPCAVSSVRISFSSITGTKVKNLLVENEKVLKLLRSEILQTEIRVLYELLYILNNSYRGNKTLKGVKQVEQCINKLKNMKLDAALQDLVDLCPNRIQRGLSIKAGECDVPSQPMLEWICLKLLGAAQLMSCTLNRCSRAFLLSKQQMKWEEFIILNMVITSMLSRLWVIFRGMLVSLSTLYQQLLEFLKDVACTQPMPFLTEFSLPVDFAQFLGPSGIFLFTKQPACVPHAKVRRETKSSVKVKNQGVTRMAKEDLGVAIERDIGLDADMKPFLKVFRDFTEGKSFPEEKHKSVEKQKFEKQVRKASTFTDMAAHLEEMILWCKSHRMEKEKRLLTFLRLKCQKMKCLEAAGHNVQSKLRSFRREACWASSPRGSMPKTFCFPAPVRRKPRLRTRFQMLKRRFVFPRVRTDVIKKTPIRQQKLTELPAPELPRDDQRSETEHKETHETTNSEYQDDIDDIFASIGL
ncbi:nucleolus and neural progenitor protein [Mugil cephalus]|uniref:nucleolus and neural progenitor protein n=1 Tax=Mugil cephalus TaxID=48193 RepID=UPI001FB5A12C|nr:nucleolus and neural progenitor protein [Mugil cephalus]